MTSLNYYDDAVFAELECSLYTCRFHARISARKPLPDAVSLAVLWQPCDPQGLAEGPPVLVFTGSTALVTSRDGMSGHATWSLAGVRPDLAQQCYFRVTPEII